MGPTSNIYSPNPALANAPAIPQFEGPSWTQGSSFGAALGGFRDTTLGGLGA